MRKIREVLRLHFECHCTHQQIASSCRVSSSTVSEYLRRVRIAGLTWPDAQELSDGELDERLFRYVQLGETSRRHPIDFDWLHGEMRRVGVTRRLLWSEYQSASLQQQKTPYGYTQFCGYYTEWLSKRRPVMRQVHRAGEKAFVDYSGKKPCIVDRETGEVTEVELFVAVLGASNYTFVEATRTQRLHDFVGSTIRALEFFGGVPQVLVPDQLRSAVTGPDRYEPDINATYLEMAQHYGTAIVPARPYRPRDKAKVEGAVLLAQRWIVACLRDQIFYSLDELNLAIGVLVKSLNDKPFQKLDGSRRDALETIDRPAMKPLPQMRYELAVRKWAKVHIDYHVAFDGRFYSAPHGLIGQRVEIRATASTIEILHEGERIASHRRNMDKKGSVVTSEGHRPKSHRDYGQWSPERMLDWAAKMGPNVKRVIELLFAKFPHPELAYRAFFGWLRLCERYGAARVDAACGKALVVSPTTGPDRKHIQALLQRGLETTAPQTSTQLSLPAHENIRGAEHFDRKENTNAH